MKIIEKFLQENVPELKIGDKILVGRFKNRKATITGFGKDSKNQPVVKTTKGDYKMFKFRISRLMPKKKDTDQEEKE